MSTTKFKELSELKTKYYPSSIWLKHVMRLARRLEHIPSIKTLLNQINLTQIALNKLVIKSHCAPEWRHLVPPSHTWEKGEFSSGIKPNWKA